MRTTFNNTLTVLNSLTNRNIALVYLEQQQQKGLCTVREIPTQTSAPLFSTLVFAGFHNKSPLLTINDKIYKTLAAKKEKALRVSSRVLMNLDMT